MVNNINFFYYICINNLKDSVYSVSFHPEDDNIIATGGGDEIGYVFDLSSLDGKNNITSELSKYKLSSHTDSISHSKFSLDGKFLATSSLDSTINIWDSESGKKIHTLEGPSEDIECMVWHPKGPALFCGSSDCGGYLWDAKSGKLLSSFYGHGGTITAAQFSPKGGKIITGSEDGSVKVWSPNNGNCTLTISGENFHQDGITSLKCHQESTIILTGGQDNNAFLSNVQSGKVLTKLSGHEGSIEDVEFSSDFKWAITSSLDGTIKIWDIGTNQCRHTITNGDNVGITKIKCTTNFIIASDIDGFLKIFDVKNGKLLRSIKAHNSAVLDFDISPHLKYISSASDDQRVCIFKFENI